MKKDWGETLRADEFDTLETRFSIRADLYIFCPKCHHMYSGVETFVMNNHEAHGFYPVDAWPSYGK